MQPVKTCLEFPRHNEQFSAHRPQRNGPQTLNPYPANMENRVSS